MDLKNLFSKNKAAASGEAKTIKDYLGLIIIVAVVCIFILSYFFLIKPFFTKQENMILDKYNKLSETDKMNGQINALTKKVEELEMLREEKFKLFVSEQEVEELYQLISFSSIRNQLKVKKLIRGEEEAIRESAPADSGVDISTLPAVNEANCELLELMIDKLYSNTIHYYNKIHLCQVFDHECFFSCDLFT